MKTTKMLLSVLLVIILFSSCTNTERNSTVSQESRASIEDNVGVSVESDIEIPEETPEINIVITIPEMSGAVADKVEYEATWIQWGGETIKQLSMAEILEGESSHTMYTDEYLSIFFGENPPEVVNAVQYITRGGVDDTPKYQIKSLDIQKPHFSDSSYDILITDIDFGNYTDLPDEAYTPEVIIVLEATWRENTCEYGFIVDYNSHWKLPKEMPEEIPEIAINYITPTMRSYTQGDTKAVTHSETSGVGQYEEKISYSTAFTKWNGTAYKRLPITKIVMEDALVPTKIVLPVCEQNETTPYRIQIDFGDYPPEYIVATQYITSGEAQEEVMVHLLRIDDSIYSIPINTLQWNSQNGNELLATPTVISIDASWGENLCEYGFIVIPVLETSS